MAAIEENLFTWRDVEARSDLDRFYLVRDHLPDEQLVQYLKVMRGQGRNDYEVTPMWNAVLAGVVFQHPSMEALIRELERNPALLEACGFDALPIQRKPVAQVVRDAVTGQLTVTSPAAGAPRYAVARRLELLALSRQRHRIGGVLGVGDGDDRDPARATDGDPARFRMPPRLRR